MNSTLGKRQEYMQNQNTCKMYSYTEYVCTLVLTPDPSAGVGLGLGPRLVCTHAVEYACV